MVWNKQIIIIESANDLTMSSEGLKTPIEGGQLKQSNAA